METKEQLKQHIAELEEENKRIEHFKENNGYDDWDTIDLLEDLQSTALQAEDDTDVVRDLLAMFKIEDENKIIEKIKDLQEENAKLQERLETKAWEVEELMHERKRLENDYMKLQEQLKFVNIPKYKLDEEVYVVDLYLDNISSGKIQTIRKSYNSDYECNEFEYEVQFTDCDDNDFYDSEMYFEHEIFKTQTEAQKYLEGHK